MELLVLGGCLLCDPRLETAIECLKRLLHCDFAVHGKIMTVDFLCLCMVSHCAMCLFLLFIIRLRLWCLMMPIALSSLSRKLHKLPSCWYSGHCTSWSAQRQYAQCSRQYTNRKKALKQCCGAGCEGCLQAGACHLLIITLRCTCNASTCAAPAHSKQEQKQ